MMPQKTTKPRLIFVANDENLLDEDEVFLTQKDLEILNLQKCKKSKKMARLSSLQVTTL